MHRIGVHEYTYLEGLEMEREDGRRCMSEQEMRDAGMSINQRGRWQIDALVEDARLRLSKAQPD